MSRRDFYGLSCSRPGRRADGLSARSLQLLHDLCLVRAPALFERQGVVRGGGGELVDRFVRVPAAGAGEPHWLRGALLGSAQDSAGSDHAYGVHSVLAFFHEGVLQVGLRLGGTMHGGGGVLHVPLARGVRDGRR